MIRRIIDSITKKKDKTEDEYVERPNILYNDDIKNELIDIPSKTYTTYAEKMIPLTDMIEIMKTNNSIDCFNCFGKLYEILDKMEYDIPDYLQLELKNMRKTFGNISLSIIGLLLGKFSNNKIDDNDDVYYKLSLLLMKKIPNFELTSGDIKYMSGIYCKENPNSPKSQKILTLVSKLTYANQVSYNMTRCPTKKGGSKSKKRKSVKRRKTNKRRKLFKKRKTNKKIH